MTDELFIKRSADFSPCRTWRYTLKRVWDDSKPIVLFILLNPSTADETKDDPTNRRAIVYAMDWDFGGVTFCNLFAVRSPYPKVIKEASDPIGPANDYWITKQAQMSDKVIVAWGTHGWLFDRDMDVIHLLTKARAEMWCMGLTKAGHPKHILYLKRNLTPIQYKHGMEKLPVA